MAYINQSLKVFRHADRIAELQRGGIPFPVNIEIDISNRCLLGCEFCHFSYTHVKGPLAKKQENIEYMGDLMDFSIFSRFIREAKDCGVQSITMTGGGDPLTHPRFDEFLEIANDLGFEIGLYTSAVGMKKKFAEAIKNYCRWVVISIDEPDAESYKRLKQTNGFYAACSGVKAIIGGSAVIGSSFLLNKNNVYKIPSMIKLHDKLGSNYILFRPTIQYDLNNPNRMIEDPSEWIDAAINLIRSLEYDSNTQAKRTDIEWSIDKFNRYKNWRRDYLECVANTLTGVITPNGKMWACVNRRGFPESCIGDLSKKSFNEVWSNQKRRCDFNNCRVACRGDELNMVLSPLMSSIMHEKFI